MLGQASLERACSNSIGNLGLPQHRVRKIDSDQARGREAPAQLGEGIARAAPQVEHCAGLDPDGVEMQREARAHLALQHRMLVVSCGGALE